LGLIIHQKQNAQFWIIFKSHQLRVIMAIGAILSVLFVLTFNDAFHLLAKAGWVGPRTAGGIAYGLSRLQESNFWHNFLGSYLLETWINAPWSGLGPIIPLWLAWLGLAGVILSGLVLFIPRHIQSWLLMGCGLLIGSTSIYILLLSQSYRSIHSLLLPIPYSTFAILMLRYARRQKSFQVTLLTATTALYLILGTIVLAVKLAERDAGGLEWGQRYALTIYPLLGICAVVGMYHFYQTTAIKKSKQLLLGLSLVLLLVGIQYQIRGIREIQTTKNSLVAQASVMEKIQQPIVTDLWWLSSALATCFVEQEMYTLSQREELYRWLDLVKGKVNSFVFVSLGSLDNDFIQAAPYPIRRTQEQVIYNLTFTEFEILGSATLR
jgi:hypothetical protein